MNFSDPISGSDLKPVKLDISKPRPRLRPRLTRPPIRAPKRVGSNGPCPCKSGKKYKKCCLSKHSTRAWDVEDQLKLDRLRGKETIEVINTKTGERLTGTVDVEVKP